MKTWKICLQSIQLDLKSRPLHQYYTIKPSTCHPLLYQRIPSATSVHTWLRKAEFLTRFLSFIQVVAHRFTASDIPFVYLGEKEGPCDGSLSLTTAPSPRQKISSHWAIEKGKQSGSNLSASPGSFVKYPCSVHQTVSFSAALSSCNNCINVNRSTACRCSLEERRQASISWGDVRTQSKRESSDRRTAFSCLFC